MNKNDDKRKMLEEAANFFSPDQIRTDKEKKTVSVDASLQAAMELFTAARPSVGEMIKHKKDNLAKDIQGVMLNKYSCVLKEITSTLSQDTVLRKQLVEFSNKYME